MLQALLRGKLSSNQENTEDVLTSCVFGSFQHMDPNSGLVLFLAEARGDDPIDRPFAGLRIDVDPVYEFWPYWARDGYQGCEPDVVIQFRDDGGKNWLVLIEVKYRSGKSAHADDDSEAPTDQLAKEWDHLVARAAKGGSKPILVYVTSDVIFPVSDIAGARKEYEAKRGGSPDFKPLRCYWVSWRSLHRLFENEDGAIAADLRALADKLGFKEFDGFTLPSNVRDPSWRYSLRFDWSRPTLEPNRWRYGS